MVLMAIGRNRGRKVQRTSAAPREMCETLQALGAQKRAKRRNAQPFGVVLLLVTIYCAVTLGRGAARPAADAVGDCTARIA